MIALFQDDHPIIGIIDQPVTGERWIGAEGRATVFRAPFGGEAGSRRCPVLSDAELSCTSPEMFGTDTPRWERLRRAVRRNSWGGDCYAHGLVALGQIDIVAESDMKVWDWGALVPVIEGAGGSVTDWQGQALRPEGDGRVLSVGDKALLPAILRELNLSPVVPPPDRAATLRCAKSTWDSYVRFFILLLSLTLFTHAAAAQSASPVQPKHGFTVLGEPALPRDFKAFPYVIVNEREGGEVHLGRGRHFRQLQSLHPARHLGSARCRSPGSPCQAVPARARRADMCGRAC